MTTKTKNPIHGDDAGMRLVVASLNDFMVRLGMSVVTFPLGSVLKRI